MCEATAYLFRGGKEELVMESVDVIEPENEGEYRLINIFGDQRIIKARLKKMNLLNHKIVFEG